MLGEDSALGILSVESRKSWGRRGTFAIFSHIFGQLISKFPLLEILLIVTFSDKTVKEHLLPVNSPSLEVLDAALNSPVL